MTSCKSLQNLYGLPLKVAGEGCLQDRLLILIPSSPSHSKKYIDSILSKLPAEQLHLSTSVQAVSSGEGKATLVTATGQHETFDHIIIACHTDEALRILDAGGGATPEEREILGVYRWSKNDVWLHSDVRVSAILSQLSAWENGG